MNFIENFLQMPHESTVDPEEPMHFKSWGEEKTQPDSPSRHRSIVEPAVLTPPRFNHSISATASIQTHPDLPLHVTHDHDDDGDPDDENSEKVEPDLEFDLRSRITYTPPRRITEITDK